MGALFYSHDQPPALPASGRASPGASIPRGCSTDRKINPRPPAQRFMRPPLSRYVALAQRRTMALMSRRGPLLEKKRFQHARRQPLLAIGVGGVAHHAFVVA